MQISPRTSENGWGGGLYNILQPILQPIFDGDDLGMVYDMRFKHRFARCFQEVQTQWQQRLMDWWIDI